MLPSRSKRYAHVDAEVPRLVLSTPWQLLLITVMVLSVLVTIFPRKALLSTLYEQRSIDPLTRSYIQNLYRVEQSNIDAALLLARTQDKSAGIEQLESALLKATADGTAPQRQEAFGILLEAYQWRLLHTQDTAPRRVLKAQLTTLVQRASEENLPDNTMEKFAVAALELGLRATGENLVVRLRYANPVNSLESLGARALANGQYTGAASCFLLAQHQAASIEQARLLFQRGIETYMAASLFEAALQAARVDISTQLAGDLPTLRFLARTALAAGSPSEAAHYARALVFTNTRAASKR